MVFTLATSFSDPSSIMSLAAVEVGQHWYWSLGDWQVHGQVLVVSWFVISLIGIVLALGTSDLKLLPNNYLQNLVEYLFEYIRDIAKTQIGEKEYQTWLPFIGTLFIFIFGCNWAGALIPWSLIEIPNGELAAPTNDINTTAALALLTSIAYFTAGFRKKGLGYLKKH